MTRLEATLALASHQEPLSPASGGVKEFFFKRQNTEEAIGRLRVLAGPLLVSGSHSATFQVSHTHSGFPQPCPRLQGQFSGVISLQHVIFQGGSICDVLEIARAILLQ